MRLTRLKSTIQSGVCTATPRLLSLIPRRFITSLMLHQQLLHSNQACPWGISRGVYPLPKGANCFAWVSAALCIVDWANNNYCFPSIPALHYEIVSVSTRNRYLDPARTPSSVMPDNQRHSHDTCQSLDPEIIICDNRIDTRSSQIDTL